LEVGSFSYWFDKPWFHTKGRLAAVFIIPSSWGSQLGGHLHAIKQFFWRRCRGLKKTKLPRQLHAPTSTTRQQFFWHHCRGERGFLQGESLASNLLLCYYFALFYFCLHLFIKNTKKLVPL
jgi:hypothetical protein